MQKFKNYIDLGYLAQEDKRCVYVLDTNVLLHDPASIFRFEEHIVLIPFIAIEEIDAKKNDPGIGYNARDISQKLEKLAARDEQGTSIEIPNGKNGLLSFLTGTTSKSFPSDLELSYKDNLLLSQVLSIRDNYFNRHVILVTKDRNLRIKCYALGINTEDYKHDQISEEYLASFFEPIKQISLEADEINEVFTTKDVSKWRISYRKKWRLRENEGVALMDPNGELFGLGLKKEDK